MLRSKNSDVDKQVDELLGRLQDKPEDSRLRKAIPDEVSVRGHEEKNYNCTVDFSKEYYDLTAAQEVLLRASVEMCIRDRIRILLFQSLQSQMQRSL